MSIRILTDSGADLEATEYENLKVELVPLSVVIDQRTYSVNEKFNKVDFFRMLEAAEIFPTTSQPAPGDFDRIFRDARQKGDVLIYVSVSSALSGTCQCARLVRELGEYDNVYIVDSLTATLGQKLLVLQAAKRRDEGWNAKEIVEELEQLRSRVRIFAGVDTLEYLQKGGRLGKTAAGIGTLAKVKPILALTREGSVRLHGKGIGRGKAISIILSAVTKERPDAAYPIFCAYSGSGDNLAELRAKGEKQGISVPDEMCFSIGAVIGAHVGPGAYGYVYITED